MKNTYYQVLIIYIVNSLAWILFVLFLPQLKTD